jgi:hypothetical protein
MQRLLCLFASLFLVMALAPAPVLAQIGNINALAAKSALSAQDEAAIRKYVDDQSAGLSSADPLAVKRSRDVLLRPLQESTVTLAFRGEYAKALIPILEPLLKGAVDHQAANALRVAGDLATQSVIDPLILAGLKDPRSSVRYAAAFAAARMYEMVALHSPAITASKLSEVMRTVAELIKTEADPLVLDGLVLAMRSALRVPDKIQDANFTWNTVSALADAAAARVAKLASEDKPGAVVAVMLRITLALREAATGANLAVPEPQRVKILKFCSDAIAIVRAQKAAAPAAAAKPADVEKLRADLGKLEESLNSLTNLLGGKPAAAAPRAPGGN